MSRLTKMPAFDFLRNQSLFFATSQFLVQSTLPDTMLRSGDLTLDSPL